MTEGNINPKSDQDATDVKTTSKPTGETAEELNQESNKILEVIRLARMQHETYMEETWEERIPIECSTPKLLSFYGKQLETEFRRNSISLASSYKRKISPQGDRENLRRIKFNSSTNIPQDVTEDPLKNHYKDEPNPETDEDPFDRIEDVIQLKSDSSDEDKNNPSTETRKDDNKKEVINDEALTPPEKTPDETNSNDSKSPPRGRVQSS